MQQSGLVSVLVTLAILLLILVRRVRGQELRPQRLFVLPFLPVLLGVGAVAPQIGLVHLHGIDYTVLAADLALSVVIGAIRGRTVLIYQHAGTTWYRYGPLTVALWFLSIVLRVALGIYGAHHGATQLATSDVVLLMFGLTLLVQNAIVWARYSATGDAASV